MGVINGQERFDADTTKHSHFVCGTCGRVLDVFEPLVSAETLAGIERKYALRIFSEDIIFNGTCPDCQEKPKAE